MDENKNWINYKRFDAYSQLSLIGFNRIGSFNNYTFEKVGLYIIMAPLAYQSANAVLNTTANNRILVNNSSEVNSGKLFLAYIYANIGDTLNFSYGTARGSGVIIVYLSGRYTTASINNKAVGADNTRVSLSLQNVTNRVLIGINAGTSAGTSAAGATSTGTQVITDGRNYTVVSSIDETCTISAETTGRTDYGMSVLYDLIIS